MKRVLEIGSGEGFNSYVLSKRTDTVVTGIDLDPKNTSIATSRYPGIRFLTMSAESMRFKNNEFDEVHAYDVLEHVDHLEQVIHEIVRVLKPHGKCIVNVPAGRSERWLLSIRPNYFKEIHHVRIFESGQLEKISAKYGLVCTKKEYRGFLQHIELFVLFTRNVDSKTQVSIGSWRDTWWTKLVHVIVLYFDPSVLSTPLVYIPLWIITVPMGLCFNFFGNRVFPKSQYYEFIKKT